MTNAILIARITDTLAIAECAGVDVEQARLDLELLGEKIADAQACLALARAAAREVERQAGEVSRYLA